MGVTSGVATAESLSLAAVDAFESRGFDATSVKEIAAAVGVSERTFFRHFPTKERVLYPDRDRIVELLPELAARHTDVVAALSDGLEAITEWRHGDRELWARRYSIIDAHPGLIAFDRSLDAGVIELISDRILEAAADGGDTAPAPETVIGARALAGFITVGASYILRAAARGAEPGPLIESLLARASGALAVADPLVPGEPPASPRTSTTVVVLGDPSTPEAKAVLDAIERATPSTTLQPNSTHT